SLRPRLELARGLRRERDGGRREQPAAVLRLSGDGTAPRTAGGLRERQRGGFPERRRLPRVPSANLAVRGRLDREPPQARGPLAAPDALARPRRPAREGMGGRPSGPLRPPLRGRGEPDLRVSRRRVGGATGHSPRSVIALPGGERQRLPERISVLD